MIFGSFFDLLIENGSLLPSNHIRILTIINICNWIYFFKATQVFRVEFLSLLLLLLSNFLFLLLYLFDFDLTHFLHFIPLCNVFILLFVKNSLLFVFLDVKKTESVFNKTSFYPFVNFSVIVETGHVIYFQQPRFKFFVEHNVKSKNLKALPVILLSGSRSASSIIMVKLWPAC